MDPVTDSSAVEQAVTPGNGRMTLLLIAGIPVIVILASTWMWFYVASGKIDLVGALGTSNNGELVQPPRALPAGAWVDGNAKPFELASPPKWTLLVPHRGPVCAEACEKQLYATRQIHMSLGKELGRVQRLLVVDTPIEELRLSLQQLSDQRPLPADFASYIEMEQRGLTVVKSAQASFESLFSEFLVAEDSWYLMDPNGFVMMRYDASVNYKDVISDLKFLIKNSNG